MNSTVDFSKKPLEDGLVDSPLKKNLQFTIIYSASSLHAIEVQVLVATISLCDVARLVQRKVFEDANYGIFVTKLLATCWNASHNVLGSTALSS